MGEPILPLAYRWFLAKGLTDWEPWYFVDTLDSLGKGVDLARHRFAAEAFAAETGADFEVYLFARRQDMETFAFFAVRDGFILDRVVSIHLSFSGRRELRSPLRVEDLEMSFTDWVGSVCLRDAAELMDEEDLLG
ncbi:hypothetical protein [Pseudoduganella violacea]|uniref:Uncharacterized protein n=1 Tax=Pseudoduganella violacea TaxID=1715466 RepID=A0A7W5FTD5_9BURK|nr:hypothetical protein [Pseudoduganella violacea]MBB3118476.1 hypothetical protein [Pseudoduganella violacea]